MAKVIVFGPTGNVGSVAARTAQEQGAEVFLAMRDTKKTIPGLSPEEERAGGFERVQADLTKPDTIADAVKTTGAERAFIYLAFGSQDAMRSTLEALKSGGVRFVVFLSSCTVHGDLHDFTPSQFIPFAHAQVELNLEEIFGVDNFVAVRPGEFATNLLRHKSGIVAGNVRVYQGAYKFDCITPDSMGAVIGTILVQGPKNGQKKVYLYGPREVTQREAYGILGKVLGKDMKVTEANEQEALQDFEKEHIPRPVAEYIVQYMREMVEAPPSDHTYTHFEEGVKNVELYTGRPSIGLEEWVAANKELFSA